MNKLKRLFELIKIGQLEIKNRLVMPAMHVKLPDSNGTVTDRLIDFYVERAKGGVGLIIVEGAVIIPLKQNLWRELIICDDKVIPGLKRLVDAIHQYDTKIALQIYHMGRIFPPMIAEPVAPSSIPTRAMGRLFKEGPRELTIEDIDDIEEAFAQGARRVKEAGFDSVEIHCGHGYLINQFLSPYTNKRTDGYGGDLRGRMRFVLEILERTRGKVGKVYPIMVKISGDEYLDGGLTLQDSKIIAQNLEQAGVHAIQVSAGAERSAGDESPIRMGPTPPMAFPRGCLVHLAEGIKDVVSVPVIAVGRINDPVFAEEVLQQGKADLVAMGRALLADPELPSKASEGRFADIRKCIGCNRCMDLLLNPLDQSEMRCSVNAMLGKEREYKIEPVKIKKNVFVIGGGPAGMEAARVAALRGHGVCLYEKDNKLGGQLNLAVVPPHKEEIGNIVDYLSTQTKKLGVRVELGREFDLKLVEGAKPEVVIIAIGSTPIVPEIPGINHNVILANDVLAGKPVGQKVAIVGGGTVGCETAEFLAKKGKDVTVIEMLPRICQDATFHERTFLKQRLAAKRVKILTNAKVTEIAADGLRFESGEKKQLLRADTIIIAVGARPNRELAELLQDRVTELHIIGDSARPGKILDAVHQGFQVGYTV